jgi:hypothetical protein
MGEYDEPVYTDYNEYETVYFEDYKIFIEDAEELPVVHEELPDQWISNNQDILYNLYLELKEMSQLNHVFETLTFPELCDYFDYTEHVHEIDTYDFSELEIDPPPARRTRLTFKQFCGRHYITLHSLYEYIGRIYNFKCGSFEGFMNFAFMSSLHRI